MKNTRRLATPALCFAILAAWSGPVRADVKSYAASVPFASAKLQLVAEGGMQPVIYVTVSTDDPKQHSLYCFNGYRDLSFVLRDASGRVVPPDPDAWKTHSDILEGNMVGYVPGAPDPCKTVEAAKHRSYIQLRALYPNVRAGAYTLQVLLSPRGSLAHAAFPPLAVEFP